MITPTQRSLEATIGNLLSRVRRLEVNAKQTTTVAPLPSVTGLAKWTFAYTTTPVYSFGANMIPAATGVFAAPDGFTPDYPQLAASIGTPLFSDTDSPAFACTLPTLQIDDLSALAAGGFHVQCFIIVGNADYQFTAPEVCQVYGTIQAVTAGVTSFTYDWSTATASTQGSQLSFDSGTGIISESSGASNFASYAQVMTTS